MWVLNLKVSRGTGPGTLRNALGTTHATALETAFGRSTWKFPKWTLVGRAFLSHKKSTFL